jgi:glutathione S-transferase
MGMAQPPLQLVIGNYNTSSWSLRAWLAMRLARLAFTEIRVPLRREDTPASIRRYSPSGKLPVLLVDGTPVWDSLSIAELVAELDPAVWPADAARRAEARSISAEMHSGFADLRRLMPMDVVSRFAPPGRMPRGLTADIARISAIWRSCRDRYAADGPFLFGAFSLADAMMAPVASRLVTHAVPLDTILDDYVDSVMSWPDMVVWRDAADAEVEALRDRGALEIQSVARAGREVPDEPLGGAQLLAATAVEPSPPRRVEPQGVVSLDATPDVTSDEAPEAVFEEVPAIPVEPSAMPEAAPAPQGRAEPPRQDASEQMETPAIAASPLPVEQQSPPADEPPPSAPPPARTAAAPSAASARRPPVVEPATRPLPEATPEAGAQVEAPRRPGGTTIKPIGSGILRRR